MQRHLAACASALVDGDRLLMPCLLTVQLASTIVALLTLTSVEVTAIAAFLLAGVWVRVGTAG
jgi:hypothetical protein